MKHFRSLHAVSFAGVLALALASADAVPAVAAVSSRPTGDIVERFVADPLADSRWFASGSWTWEPRGTTFASKGAKGGNLLWLPGSHYTGDLKLRFRLETGTSRARLLFAFDPATGAQRWVEVAAGPPGRVTVGQTGSIRGSAPGVIQAWRASVATGTWQDLGLQIAADKSVTVTLGKTQLFRAAAAPIAPGLVGYASSGGSVVFDEFSFTAKPDGEPCRECHAGQPDQPLAANVYAYWDGKWWDANRGGSPTVQQGGHGDPGGKPALGCTGANGCHEMRRPSPEGHRNGTREGRASQSVNSYHLRPGFIVEQPENPWDAQLVFDNYCTTACHTAAQVPVMTHEKDSTRVPPLGIPGVTQFGDHLSRADGETVVLPVDSDITRRATPAAPDFAPCVSCHDPHGSGTITVPEQASNLMLRVDLVLGPATPLCSKCHI